MQATLPFVCGLFAFAACGSTPKRPPPDTTAAAKAPESMAADANMVAIDGGAYVSGSSEADRQRAYDEYLDSAGSDVARERKWFDREQAPAKRELEAFVIDRAPVTQAAYLEFAEATSAKRPSMDRETWNKQGFVQHYDRDVEPFFWLPTGPIPARRDHPVVLVDHPSAAAYCKWRGTLVGKTRRLPTEHEFERAARGTQGRRYPWGNAYEPSRLHGAHSGIRHTVPIGSLPGGATKEGVLGLAGNVFHWTSSRWDEERFTVKGSAWDDYAGVGRGAARHGRRAWVRHILVGFRCAGPATL